jgi:predicted O-methyltransferase YrrM
MRIPKFVRRILWTEEDIVFYPLAFFEKFEVVNLKLAVHNCVGVEDFVNLVFSSRVLTINPDQVKDEIAALVEILARRRPRYVLEIGTSSGGTLFLFTKISSPDAVITSINLPTNRFADCGYPRWRIPIYKSFATQNQKINLIRQNSHDSSTLGMAKRILQGRKLDFLFLDGDHTYEGVKMDFEMYASLVDKGGIVAFHDIVPGPKEVVGGVPRFWDEIKHKFKYIELVKDRKQGGFGIGVVTMQ